MPKTMQSVCKRTRSSKQTSLLDFEAPKARRASAPSASTTEAATMNISDDDDADKPIIQLKSAAAAASKKRRRISKSATIETAIDNAMAAKPPRVVSAKRRKRATVCTDVTTATASAAASSSSDAAATIDLLATEVANKNKKLKGSSKTKTTKKATRTAQRKRTQHESKPEDGSGSDTAERQLQQKQKSKQKSIITPSPDFLARKEAAEKNAAACSSSDDEEMVTTPFGKASSTASNNDNSLPVIRAVTISPQDAATVPNPSTPSPSSHNAKAAAKQQQHQQDQKFVPTFHHPWHKPYTTSVPPGVVDIDLLPHQCCLNSLSSHAGYSYMTSKRRCGCARDGNHCSSENLAEAYLGSYGKDRYGGVGMAGLEGSTHLEMNKDDWRAERWWLDTVQKETERMAKNSKGGKSGRSKLHKLEKSTPWADIFLPPKKSGARTSSPTSSLSDVSPSSKSSQSRSSQQQLAEHSMQEHLDYMSRQPHITIEMRRILMDWLLEVSEEYKLSTEAFWLSATLVDRALACSYDDGSVKEKKHQPKRKSKKGDDKNEKSNIGGEMIVEKDKLQLVGCACTLIASKLVEITPPTADDFVYISDKTYTRKEILETESKVCNALKFNVNFVTPYQHVDRFLRASSASSETLLSSSQPGMGMMAMHGGMNSASNVLMKKLVVYLLDLATLEYKLVSKKPSLVAASAVYLARATLGIREPASTPTTPTSETRYTLAGRNNSSTSSPSFQRAAKGFWSKTLEYYTGYDMWDLEESVRMLHGLHENAEDSSLVSTFNKHKAAKFKRVALKTVVNESELGFL